MKLESLEQNKKYIKKTFRFLFAYTGTINILLLITSLYSYYILERIIRTKNLDNATIPTFIVSIVYVLTYFLISRRSSILGKISKIVGYTLFNGSLKMGILTNAKMSNNFPGKKIVQDLKNINKFTASKHGIIIFLEMPWALAFIPVVAFFSIENAIICIIGIAIFILLGLLQYFIYCHHIVKETKGQVYNITFKTIGELFDNYIFIKGMNLYKKIAKITIKNEHILYKKLQDFEIKHNAIFYFGRLLKIILQLSIFLHGLDLYIQGKFHINGLILTSIFVTKIIWPFESMLGSILSFVKTRDSFHRLSNGIKQIENIANEIEICDNPNDKRLIHIQNAEYKYNNYGGFLLNDINFEIKRGEIISILGAGQSGKSTLLKICASIIEPISGYVTFNLNTKLDDKKNISQEKFLSYFQQEIKLLPGNIEQNISNFSENIKLDDVVYIAKMFGIHDKISMLANKYNTNIDIINQLSTTLKKQIALASAFYNNSKVIILDDPFAFFDKKYSERLIAIIKNYQLKGTAFIISTYNPDVLESSDKIILLQNGSIAGQGTISEIQKILGII